MSEPINSIITAWLPETDQHTLAVLGKLAEEASELAGRAARAIIQGLDGIDPISGRTNREELGREMADVQACMHQAEKRLAVPYLPQRALDKSLGFNRWHGLIDSEACK